MRRFALLSVLGGALAYFFNPTRGPERRKLALDRVSAFFRGGVSKTEELGQAVSAEVAGVAEKAKRVTKTEKEKPQPSDATLARKVETEIFRDDDVPKGQINVNAENGIVVLRGEVGKPELIKDLEARTRKVQGVKDVENLLHTPDTEAEMHSKKH